MMIFSRSWLGEGSWSALASVGFVNSRSPNTSLNTLAMWRCCSTQQCSSMDRITGKLREAGASSAPQAGGEGGGSRGHWSPSPSLLQALEPGRDLHFGPAGGANTQLKTLAATSQNGDRASGCVSVRASGVGGQGGRKGRLSTCPLKMNHRQIKPTNLEVTKAWSLMACTTSSNLILVVRVQPW